MDNDLKTAGARLRHLRKMRGYETAEHFARALGMRPSTVFGHENGNRGIKPSVAEKYARRLKTTPEAILYGKQFNQDYVNQPIIAVDHIAPIRLPLLSCLDVEQFRSIASGAIPMSDQEVFAPNTLLDKKRAFVVEMPDRSMEGTEDGSIKAGEQVFIDPDAGYKAGEIVAALAPGFLGLIVRKYRVKSYDQEGKELFELHPINSDYPAVIGEAADNALIIGRVIGAFRKF